MPFRARNHPTSLCVWQTWSLGFIYFAYSNGYSENFVEQRRNTSVLHSVFLFLAPNSITNCQLSFCFIVYEAFVTINRVMQLNVKVFYSTNLYLTLFIPLLKKDKIIKSNHNFLTLFNWPSEVPQGEQHYDHSNDDYDDSRVRTGRRLAWIHVLCSVGKSFKYR